MITDNDILKLKEVFATKDDLLKLKEVFSTKNDLQKLKNELESDMFTGFTSLMVEMAQMRNDFQTGFTSVIQEIRSIRQEMAGELDDHEDRITTIEKKLPRNKKLST